MKKISRPALAVITAFVFAMPGIRVVQAEVSAEVLKSLSVPDKIETPIGKLEFFDGVPTEATIDTLYDNLDRMRAVEVYLNNQGAASVNAMRAGNAGIGSKRIKQGPDQRTAA